MGYFLAGAGELAGVDAGAPGLDSVRHMVTQVQELLATLKVTGLLESRVWTMTSSSSTASRASMT